MLARRVLVLRHRPQLVPCRARDVALDDLSHLRCLGAIEKKPRRSNELQGIPFDRIVTGGDGKSAGGVVMLYRQLHRRRRHHPDIDHVTSNRLQRGVDGGLEHRARDATVAANNDPRLAAGARHRPGAEAGGEFRDDLRCKGFTDASPHAGDADHQSFVSHRKSSLRISNCVARQRIIYSPPTAGDDASRAHDLVNFLHHPFIAKAA